MTIRPTRHLLLPLLALGMTLAMVASAHAQSGYPRTGGTSATLQITFGSTPHWTSVRGTRVQQIRQGERPDYDMFRYGGTYYVYSNDQWYSSRRGRGQFRAIDARFVPRELTRVPREHWRNYPSAWGNQYGNPRSDNNRRRY